MGVAYFLGAFEPEALDVEMPMSAAHDIRPWNDDEPGATREEGVGLRAVEGSAGDDTLECVGLPRPGDLFAGRYRIERLVGIGTTGVVFEARDVELGRCWAIKFVDLEHFPPSLRRLIYTDVKALAQLSTPHVVRLQEVLRVSEGIIALVMEFASGQNLGELLAYHGRLSPEVALELVRQVAQALFEVHRQGLIHRDVKPDNVMVEELPGGRVFVRLLDFGIARSSRAALEEGDTFLGTPLYAAPEQNDPSTQLDHRCDIYALGVMLYQLLAGRPPYDAPTFEGLMRAHLMAPIPALPADVAPDAVRESLDALIGEMVAKHRALRPDDMVEVMGRIDALAPLVRGVPRRAVEGARPAPQGELGRTRLERRSGG